MKYVVVSGGVLSGLGKGVTASSIGVLLKSAGLKVTSIKIDPYLNSDAGTMSPFEHGEVFVLDDGGEVDLDLGNYSCEHTKFNSYFSNKFIDSSWKIPSPNEHIEFKLLKINKKIGYFFTSIISDIKKLF